MCVEKGGDAPEMEGMDEEEGLYEEDMPQIDPFNNKHKFMNKEDQDKYSYLWNDSQYGEPTENDEVTAYV